MFMTWVFFLEENSKLIAHLRGSEDLKNYSFTPPQPETESRISSGMRVAERGLSVDVSSFNSFSDKNLFKSSSSSSFYMWKI